MLFSFLLVCYQFRGYGDELCWLEVYFGEEVIFETPYKGGDFVDQVEYFEAGAGKYQVQILGKCQ